ncbi:MAG: hypothetical protein MMC33_003075 [Icmadophila ericetorum]|nr:hypothetical protein [Icmadophila ericetorum]
MLYTTLALLAAAGSALAQRPSNVSICDYYTTALLKNNTAKNQYTLLTLVVNTAVIGNYTTPNVGIAVNGILNPGMYNGTQVNLLPYFDGGLASTNSGGSAGVAQNFLDDGGAAPLKANLPANGTSSAQFTLLTHLYQYFGTLLGCSLQGSSSDFPAYGGGASQYSVHKYMDLDAFQLGYFITQVGLSAASFGVADADVTAVGEALAMYFDYKCSAATTIIPAQGAQLQAICINSECPTAPVNASCGSYGVATEPAVANASLAGGQGNASATPATGSATVSVSATATGSGSATGSAATASTTASGAYKVVGGFASLSAAVFAAVMLL